MALDTIYTLLAALVTLICSCAYFMESGGKWQIIPLVVFYVKISLPLWKVTCGHSFFEAGRLELMWIRHLKSLTIPLVALPAKIDSCNGLVLENWDINFVPSKKEVTQATQQYAISKLTVEVAIKSTHVANITIMLTWTFLFLKKESICSYTVACHL